VTANDGNTFSRAIFCISRIALVVGGDGEEVVGQGVNKTRVGSRGFQVLKVSNSDRGQ